MSEYDLLKAEREALLKEQRAVRHRNSQIDNELHNLRQKMKAARLRQISLDSRCDLSDPNQLIQAAHLLLVRLAQDEVEFEPDELAVMDALREWGNTHPPPDRHSRDAKELKTMAQYGANRKGT